jgi:UrcA family protein
MPRGQCCQKRVWSVLKSMLAGVGVIAIAGVTAVALHAGYYPDDDTRPRSLGVSAAGLDLSSPAGVSLLEQRVARAVQRVCDGDAECRDDAWAGARPQIWAAIDRARMRGGSYGAERHSYAASWAPPPPRDWHDDDGEDEQRAGYVSAPPPEPMRGPAPGAVRRYASPAAHLPLRGQAPIALSGVLGGPIDPAIDRAFETGEATRWRDHGWHGVVQVSESREVWPNICRTVTIVRAVSDGWAPLREGVVCLGRDGQLHNSRRN